MREVPIMAPAPVVTDHAAVCRDVCEHQGQCRHVQHALTGLLVLPHKRLATIARGIRDRADHTHLSRVRSEAPWREEEVTRRRLRFLLQQTKPHHRRRRESLLAIDASPVRTGGESL